MSNLEAKGKSKSCDVKVNHSNHSNSNPDEIRDFVLYSTGQCATQEVGRCPVRRHIVRALHFSCNVPFTKHK